MGIPGQTHGQKGKWSKNLILWKSSIKLINLKWEWKREKKKDKNYQCQELKIRYH